MLPVPGGTAAVLLKARTPPPIVVPPVYVRATLHVEGKPAYPAETLKWHTGKWKAPPSVADLFGSLSAWFYRGLYRTLTAGAPLQITPQQVRRGSRR